MSETLNREDAISSPEGPRTVTPIPLKDLERLLLDSSGETYYERTEKVPGIEGPARLLVIHERVGAGRLVWFHYIADLPGAKEEYVASMTLTIIDAHDAVLSHREVKIEHGQGTGTALYLQTEDFARQLVERQRQPMTISAEFDQYDVLKWLDKLGYEPTDESRELYEDIMANVGVTDKYYVDYDNTSGYRPLSIFERTPEGHPKAMPVRIVMQRVVESALAQQTKAPSR